MKLTSVHRDYINKSYTSHTNGKIFRLFFLFHFNLFYFT